MADDTSLSSSGAADALVIAAKALHKLKLPALAANARLFIDTESTSKKIALLTSIISIFTDEPLCLSAVDSAHSLKDVIELFKTFLGDKSIPEGSDDGTTTQAVEAAFSNVKQQVTLNLGRSILDQDGDFKHRFGDFLVKYADLVQPAFAVMGLIAAACGIHKMVKVDIGGDTIKDMLLLSKTIFSIKNNWKAATEIIDPMMSCVYSFFGVEYITSKHRSVLELSKKMEALHNECQEVINKVKTDFFGFRLETATSLSRKYEDLNKAVTILQAQEQSMFNFATRMSKIQENISALNDIAIDKYKSKAGKQRPVVLWVAGKPGTGKTHLACKMGIRVAKALGTDVYSRTVSDEFWSSYQGQLVVAMDDMMQSTEGKDVIEFHRYTSEDAKDVIGAGLTDKGRPFVSTVMVVSSNFMWFQNPLKIQDKLALCRRRDICLYAYNPDIEEYADAHHGNYPDGEWFEKHPTRWFLYNPTYGHNFDKSANAQGVAKFYPEAPYVIREVTEDQVFECILNLELRRREAFRQRLESIEETKYAIPSEKFVPDESKIFFNDKPDIRNLPFDAASNESAHADIVRMDLEFVSGQAFDGPDRKANFGKFVASRQSLDHVPTEAEIQSVIPEFWVAKNGNLVQHSSRTYNSRQLELYVLRKHINITPIPVFNWNEETFTWEEYRTKDPSDTAPQGNPLRRFASDKKFPGLLIMGPPKTGKTYSLKRHFDGELYRVKYEKEEHFPTDKILFFDDISNSVERILAFKQVLGDFYDNNPRGWRFVVATLNSESITWTGLPKDDRHMMERRCHKIRTSYTTWTRMRMVVGKLDDIITPSTFDDAVTGKIELHPDRDEGFEDLRDAHSAIAQIINVEATAMKEQRIKVYNRGIKLPRPKKPVLTVVLPHDTKPDVENTKFLYDSGAGPAPLRTAERLRLIATFAKVLLQLGKVEIADRSEAAYTITCKEIPNSTGFDEWLIVAPSFELIITTIEKKIVAIEVDNTLPYDYESYASGFYFNGKMYQYDDQFDVDFSGVLARVHSLPMHAIPDVFEHPSVEQFAPATKPIALVRSIAATIDLASQILSAATIIWPESERTEEERKKRVPGDNKSDKSDSSAADKQRPRAVKFESDEKPERKARMGARGHSSAATDTSNDKNRKARTQFENSDQMTQLIRVGPVKDCTYGVAYQDCYYVFEEVKPKTWTMFIKALPENAEILETHHLVSRTFLNKTLGKTINTAKHPDLDFACAFATYVCSGVPRDIDREVQAPEALEYITWGKPRPLLSREKAIEESTTAEGTVDKAAFETAQNLWSSQAKLVDETGQRELWALMLGGNEGITCAHSTVDTIEMLGKTWPIETVKRAKQADLRLFRVTDKTFPSQPDITSKIVSAEELGSYLGETNGKTPIILPLRTDKEIPYLQIADATTQARAISSCNDRGTIRYRVKADLVGYTGVTKSGDCGTPVLLLAPRVQRKICAIHMRGANDISLATILTQEVLKEMRANEETEESTRVQSVQNRDLDYLEIPFQHSETGLKVVARPKFAVFTPTTTTKFRSPLDLETEFEPSIKSKRDPRNVMRKDMLLEGMARYAEKFPTGDIQQEVNETCDEIGLYLASLMSARNMTTRMLTNTEAINGPPINEFPTSKAIDRQGSVGYPFVQKCPTRTQKQDYLYQHENGLWYFRNDSQSQAILAEASAVFAKATQGVHISMPWTAYSKDEPVKLKKIYDVTKAKTRVFFSGGFGYQLAYRRAFYAAISRITELHLEIPVRVGLRQLSLEWLSLTYQHLQVSDTGFASDMENWDGCIPIEFLRGVPRIFNKIYELTDDAWTPQDDITRSAIHRNVEGATIIIRDLAVELDHALASGFPGTAVENSLINWVLFVCCWKRLAKIHAPELATFEHFMKLVCLSVFGDDNLATVAKLVQTWFNFNTFKATAAQFGFKVTDAAKTGAAMPDVQPLEELEFLKRSFRKDQYYWLPALDKLSINKQLTWIAGAGSYEFKGTWPITPNPSVFEESLRDLWPEIALHGEAWYNEMTALILRSARGTGLGITPPTFRGALALTEFGAY